MLATLVVIGGVCQSLGLTWVGVRMLLVARRTRGLPELLLGLAFLLMSSLGIPLLVLSGYGAPHVRDMHFALFVTSLVFLDSGALLFMAFVWRVFRPRSPAARMTMIASALALSVHVAIVTVAIRSADPEAVPLEVMGTRALILFAVMMVSNAWGTVEAFTYWARLRRQQMLGLADAAASRRMLLFAIGCFAPLVTTGFTASAMARNVNPLTDPLTALGLTLTALVAGSSFTLALGGSGERSGGAAEATAAR